MNTGLEKNYGKRQLTEQERHDFVALIKKLHDMGYTYAELSKEAGYKGAPSINVVLSRGGRSQLRHYLALRSFYEHHVLPGGGKQPLKDVTRAGQPMLRPAEEKTPLPPAPAPKPEKPSTNGASVPYDNENPFSHLERARTHLVSALSELETLANNMANLPAFVREKLRDEILARRDMIRDIATEFEL
jgi:hypothetical protein